MAKLPGQSVPFEDWKLEKQRSLERVRVLKMQQTLREAMERALAKSPAPDRPHKPRSS
ncbi:MAG: hypothetical protein AAGI06_10890 [Pseudomonadota bacterium]